MTRTEFIENVGTWGELIDFCTEYCLDCCDDIYDEDGMDDCLNEAVSDWDGSWWDLRDHLRDIRQSSESGYYRIGFSRFEWAYVYDEDFQDIKLNVLHRMDDEDSWDDDENDEEDSEPADDPFPDEPTDDDLFIEDLFTICYQQASNKEEREPEYDFSIIF